MNVANAHNSIFFRCEALRGNSIAAATRISLGIRILEISCSLPWRNFPNVLLSHKHSRCCKPSIPPTSADQPVWSRLFALFESIAQSQAYGTFTECQSKLIKQSIFVSHQAFFNLPKSAHPSFLTVRLNFVVPWGIEKRQLGQLLLHYPVRWHCRYCGTVTKRTSSIYGEHSKSGASIGPYATFELNCRARWFKLMLPISSGSSDEKHTSDPSRWGRLKGKARQWPDS